METGLFAIGLAAGLVQGVFGVGAATIIIAALLVVFHFLPVEAAGTALLALALMRGAMALLTTPHGADRTTIAQLGGVGAAGAVLGALGSAGALALDWQRFDDVALRVLAVPVGLAGLYLIFWPDADPADAADRVRMAPPGPVALSLVAACGTGLITGLSGLWSGMGLSLILLFTRERLNGDVRPTLLLASTIVAGAGAAAHLLLGHVNLAVSLNVLAGAVPGVVAGNSLAAAVRLTGTARAAQAIARNLAARSGLR